MTAGEVLTYCGPVTASWVVLDWTDMATNLSLLLPRATDVAVHDMAAVVAVSYLLFFNIYKKKSREQEYKELSEIKRKKMMFQHSVAFAEFQITITSTQDDECVWKAP